MNDIQDFNPVFLEIISQIVEVYPNVPSELILNAVLNEIENIIIKSILQLKFPRLKTKIQRKIEEKKYHRLPKKLKEKFLKKLNFEKKIYPLRIIQNIYKMPEDNPTNFFWGNLQEFDGKEILYSVPEKIIDENEVLYKIPEKTYKENIEIDEEKRIKSIDHISTTIHHEDSSKTSLSVGVEINPNQYITPEIEKDLHFYQDYSPINKLYKEIEESKTRILSLKDNWDDEDSKGYKEKTWKRATEFLRSFYQIHIKKYHDIVPIPDILPGPNRSIDIHFRTEKFELLLNISDDPKAPVSFYGDNFDIITIEGTSSADDLHNFIIPLLKLIF